jgi:hypothetical protein
LRLTGRVADGWVPSFRGDLQAIIEMVGRVDDAAREAGRDPGVIRRILNVGGTITSGRSDGTFHGPVGQWADEITSLVVVHGFDTFLLWTEGDEQLQRFAEEVAPAVRAQVAGERPFGQGLSPARSAD